MSIVIIGRHGLIGSRLLARLPTAATWSTSHRPDQPGPHFDLRAPGVFDFARLRPGDTVVVTAAVASPDRCAREPAMARQANVDGTVAFARRASEHGARVILFSSDTVYGHADAPVDESALLAPAGPYADMKFAMEAAVADLPRVQVLRLSFVVHRDDSYLSYLATCVQRDAEAEVFDPFDRCVVDVEDVVDCVLELARTAVGSPRTINVGGPDLLSRVAMARIARETVLPGLRFRAAPAPVGFFDKRPARIAMRSPLLPGILGRPPRRYADVVRREWRSSTTTAAHPQ